ncbi:uncharacterized protein 1d [SARS coronavirus ZJ0301]|uniref:Uncharacterized protein 1d n=1 Tax=SARS coronavirus ZJ0301 TaxID=344702 RepID=Q3S2E1_SARS|nr:uncharacterized protein 1d [SARS coronavirus ZJ0301]
MMLVKKTFHHVCIVPFTLQMRKKRTMQSVRKKKLMKPVNMSTVQRMIIKVSLWNLVPQLKQFELRKKKRKTGWMILLSNQRLSQNQNLHLKNQLISLLVI